jgi:histone deacetylase complex regulatory component SIN3
VLILCLFVLCAISVDYCSLDVAGAMDRLQVVLHGHPDLIRGFNVFMPSGGGLKEEQGGDGAR